MIRVAAVLLAAGALGACSLAPPHLRPAAPVPPAFPTGGPYPAPAAALPSVSYQDIFRDPRLQRIIDTSLANNRDLRIAAANVAAARARYRIQRADLLPEVGAGAGATFSGGERRSANQPRTSLSADVGVTGFEIDLFGRIRSLTEAQLSRYVATEAGAHATRLTLVGDLASAWLAYASDRSLLAIAERTATSARRSVELTRARLTGGIAARTDLAQAETVLATAEADLAESRTAIAQDVNALELLAGTRIDPALLPASIDEAAPTLAELPAGLDSGVLLRRPDVVQAEYELRAADAEIGAARAALFPRISLTGLLGFASSALSSLFTGGAFAWSVSPDVSYPIFRAGAGRAGVAEANANQQAALASYERAIQSAFREVADALARRGTIGDQEAATRRLLAAAADTLRLAEARYRGGIDPFLSTLDAQRTLYTAERRLVATQQTRAVNLVTLYRVLGGDALLDLPAVGGGTPAD